MSLFLSVFKPILACFVLVGSMAINKLSPREYTQEEITAIRVKVESRIEEMRSDVDGNLGDGVFDGIVSGKIDVEEFLKCEDLDAFLRENWYDPPSSQEQTSQR